MDFVVFDLETQNSFSDVGGRHNLSQLGVSVAVAWDSRRGAFSIFRETELDDLVALLQSAPLVVGFNTLGFDYPVLQPYTRYPLDSLPSFDMLDDLYRHLGFRISLDNLCRCTLSAHKTSDGLQAITWFREGNWQKLIAYCQDDVRLTRDLFLFGREHGFVRFWDGRYRIERTVPVSWGSIS